MDDSPTSANSWMRRDQRRRGLRLALARGLLSSHRVVALHEPTAHLDPAMAATVRESVLAELCGRTVLPLGHAASHGDRTVIELG